MPTSAAPTEVDVCVLGAGPHGLALVLHLIDADPSLNERLVVLDPSGAWLTNWQDQFARLEIGHLRSPIVHHPAPDVSSLARHVATERLPRSGLPYELPTTVAFDSFCDHLVAEAGLAPPLAVQPHTIGWSDGRLQVEWADGSLAADRLVVATNPHRRLIPTWVAPLLGRFAELHHAADVDLRTVGRLDGQRVVVVGGGLTAGHLACGAAVRGADVELISRRDLVLRPFDTDPGWLGPRRLRDFDAEPDPRRRVSMAKAARGGGSMPPWMGERLDDLESSGRLMVRAANPVRCTLVHPDGGARLVLVDGTQVAADQIWLATGTEPSIEAMGCLSELVVDMGLVDGLPITDGDLRVGPSPVYMMGRLATATLGPAAGNLWGAQRAAERITRAITGIEPDHSSTALIDRPGSGS